MSKYLNATDEVGKKFYLDFHKKDEPIIMLNLLKFKLKADYTNLQSIKPQKDISGEEAYKLYTDKTSHALQKIGSKIIFYGESKNFLIGPETEKWDVVLLVKHQSLYAFIEFSKSDTYLKNVGHRTAGLEDSRLLPTTQKSNLFKK